MIDLHTHSKISDGTLSPTELVTEAQRRGLTALALTDHDTLDGLDEAEDAARRTGIIFVPGIEISATVTQGSVHLVGLHVDRLNTTLREMTEWLVESRDSRNERLAARLTELGVPVCLNEVRALAGGRAVGRPHFAQFVVQSGRAKNIAEVFKKYLGDGKKAHIAKERLTAKKVISAIREAGGVPILAHPATEQGSVRKIEKLVRELKQHGLAGIETQFSGSTSGRTRELRQIARKYELVESGGSDFHGSVKPAIELGRGLGRLNINDDLLAPLANCARDIRQGFK